MLRARYDGSKATQEFNLQHKPFEETLKKEVDWFMRNGYIRKSSRVKYYKKIGKFKPKKIISKILYR